MASGRVDGGAAHSRSIATTHQSSGKKVLPSFSVMRRKPAMLGLGRAHGLCQCPVPKIPALSYMRFVDEIYPMPVVSKKYG